ncbi:MAG: HlyD family efflux transporter periplasmic adaptor subunit [Cyclobacteriaceae bacterium]|nr:HlyD family efflux transporter periplasmic adaptor subunit [Cyclobacteriaceae bacterium]
MLNLSKNRIDRIVEQEKLYSLRAIKTPRAGIIIARFFMVVLFIFIIMLFMPWQQNIRGTGKVTPFNPGNRPQTVETAIAGRIQKWHVQEGQYVEKGDTIITLSEIREKYFDPLLLVRLKQQIDAKEQGLVAKGDKANALNRQIDALKLAMKNKIDQAKAKLDAEQIRFENLKNQYDRNKALYDAGNIPLTKFQEIEYKYRGAQADFVNAQIELDRVQAEYLDKISKAESDRNQTQAEIFETEAELAKLRNEYANMQIRNQQYQIIAPQDGIVVKAMKAGIGETIKEGDAVCMIMPAAEVSNDIAAEMYIRAMDVPLVSKGRKVRIIFDGWPALQFSGWPSVSVGTFGGVVRVIDMVNTRPGEFRLLVVPDSTDTPWPKQLRVGSGIKGWVMLDDVPIWYEIWRQLNGFPPSLYEEPLDEVIEKKSPAKKTEENVY